MQRLTYDAIFEYIICPMRRTVMRVHCKKHNFMQSFDLQGHARVQIFAYKDVSVFNVSLNFPMFYDNLNVFTQIFRLYVMFIHKFIN